MVSHMNDVVNPSSIRERNLSQVLKLIHERGSISRASMVREIGLSATAISSIVAELLDSGYISEGGAGKSSGGRRPILVEFNPDHRWVVGIDLGASHISTILSNLSGEIKVKKYKKFDVANDPKGALEVVYSQISGSLSENKILRGILGIGLAVPAPLEGEKLDTLSPVILPRWKDIKVADIIERGFGIPVYMDNDANAGALAEKWWGRGRGVTNMVYIKLGTGVGSGLIIQDDIFRGSGGTAGEIGHTTIDINGPQCRCGNFGCMESFVGIPAILEKTAERISKNSPSSLDPDHIDIDSITRAALEQDPIACEIVRGAGRDLGIAIANSINLINPELIVLGGDLVEAGDVFMEAVCASAFSRSISKAVSEVTITSSTFYEEVVSVGAATLVMYYAFMPSNIRDTLTMQKEVVINPNFTVDEAEKLFSLEGEE